MPEYHWITDRIFTVTGFFTADECAAAIRRSEAEGFADAPINTVDGPQLRQDVRNNTRVMIDDPQGAALLWSRANDFVPIDVDRWQAIGVNERFRYYRYELGQQFDWHIDGAFERENGERSRWTFMIYLNDDFSGGRTLFDGFAVAPETGMALFFEHRLLHKGEPVSQGRKYVLRTDVMYRLRD